MSKPSVNKPNTFWERRDVGQPSYGYDGDVVELFQQRDTITGKFIEHYRFKVNSKWNRKTFYGETAWYTSERFIGDKYGVDIMA